MNIDPKLLLAIGAGGALGAIGRYLAVRASVLMFGAGFPIGTLIVNVLGSLAMGGAVQWFAARGDEPVLRGFVVMGVLGAFTTFSTFSFDAVMVWRDRAPSMAALYVVASTALSIGAFLVGYFLMRRAG